MSGFLRMPRIKSITRASVSMDGLQKLHNMGAGRKRPSLTKPIRLAKTPKIRLHKLV